MQAPIRVLQVIGGMHRGGAETMIMNLYRHIDRTKIQFDFMVHTSKKMDFDDEIIALGGRIYRVPRFNGINILQYQNSWKSFLEKHIEYKIIHGHIGSSAAIYLSIAKKYGLFTIAHSHNTNEPTIKGKIYSVFSYPTRNIADYFFACSKAAGLTRYGEKVTNSNNFRILNNAINTESFIYSEQVRKKKRSELGLEGKFVLGHIGRFVRQKNHDFLINIFKKVHDKNSNAVLLLVGDGELRKSIEKKVSELGLLDAVIFTGTRYDISGLLNAMDTFVFPSLYEGLGIVAIEAQATGLHCIVSDVVPKEAFVTDLMEAISLDESLEIWSDTILKQVDYSRMDKSLEIAKHGYDIHATSRWLGDFYKDVIK